jgi:hypothetical protein
MRRRICTAQPAASVGDNDHTQREPVSTASGRPGRPTHRPEVVPGVCRKIRKHWEVAVARALPVLQQSRSQ